MRKTKLGCTILEGHDIADLPLVSENAEILENEIEKKVDKVAGKKLSTNDYTDAEKQKLAGIETGANKTVLSDSVSSTSTTTAASSKAVKTAYDKAKAAEDKANNITVPVVSVNGKTGAVKLTKSDVGLSNVDNVEQATKAEFDSHTGNKSNPHSVTKLQVGLSNVQNYGIATQAEAESGTSNTKYMTPLRVKQAMSKSKDVAIGSVNYAESIPILSTITKKISIPSNKTKGIISFFKNPIGSYRENGGMIFFSDIQNSAKSIYGSGDKTYYVSKSQHGVVVEDTTVLGRSSISITDVYIEGDEIVLKIKNTDDITSRDFACTIDWEVW